ncbi:hypothetical protein NDU88_001104 [Pleurodeles waltl]|uniref:Uncharacterized protein n=1 Tax=Pleurodeles waltl TaxID=8319 RepID=A0AAV7TGX5_PLEWA|nr:hypothetical protein NDU88_001104 [Pleurodeles waltl]
MRLMARPWARVRRAGCEAGPLRGDGRWASAGLGQKHSREHTWHGLHLDRCRMVGVEGEGEDPSQGRQRASSHLIANCSVRCNNHTESRVVIVERFFTYCSGDSCVSMGFSLQLSHLCAVLFIP